ncbi:9306_t:CDS:2, partial [Paraglomus brasilianum]
RRVVMVDMVVALGFWMLMRQLLQVEAGLLDWSRYNCATKLSVLYTVALPIILSNLIPSPPPPLAIYLPPFFVEIDVTEGIYPGWLRNSRFW